MGPTTEEEDNRLIGRVVAGKLRIDALLGSGSMGRVFRARHLGLDKDVAVKVLRGGTPDPNRSRRFAREARAASRLNHPNSVAVLDFGEDGEDKLLYIAMEFLKGVDLQDIIDRGVRIGVERACHLMVQALAGLAAAHDAGIIHRDMKPSNIVLVQQRNDDGQLVEVVKVCDFGVAKFLSGGRDTLDGGRGQKVIGTPLYMSPEQAVGDQLDPRTDVYSCGVILYEMVTGVPPFTAENPMGVLMKHVSEPLRPPSEFHPEIPAELDALIRWALEKDRERRPASARELRSALRAFLAGKAHTLPALARYGVTVAPGSSPWTGPTPFWHFEPLGPRSEPDRPLLAPPPAPVARVTPRPDLVSDLNLVGAPPVLAPSPVPELGDPGEAPPQGTPIPSLLLDALPPEDREIFSDRSDFRLGPRPSDRATLEVGEVLLDAPPPRALSRSDDSDPNGSPAARDGMATYAWRRFGLSPHRRVPPEGFWLRDAEDRVLGPCTWTEVTQILRAEAASGGIERVSVSSDERSWLAAERFAHLTGVEAVLEPGDPLPKESRIQGRIGDRSVTAVLGMSESLTGRWMFELGSVERRIRFDVHIEEGRPTLVFTNEPGLQLPNLLVAKGVLAEDRLPRHVRVVLAEARPLEDVVAKETTLDAARYRSAMMKERLRHLLRHEQGRFAFDDRGRPSRHLPFSASLLGILPDLVYRAIPGERLELFLGPMLDRPIAPPGDARSRVAKFGLTRTQQAVAERILGSPRLGSVLPAGGRLRKAYTTMAYVLRELDLLGPTR